MKQRLRAYLSYVWSVSLTKVLAESLLSYVWFISLTIRGKQDSQGQSSPVFFAEGLVDLLEDGEARHREASGGDQHKQEAAAERARKAMKANRDKKTGRNDAQDALQEDAAGMHATAFALKPVIKLAACTT